MTNDTLQTTAATSEVILTPDKVKNEILLALTAAEQSIQLLHTAKATLVFNEDNLETIKKYLDNCKEAADVVEQQRKQKKKPFWDNGVAVDTGAKILSDEIEELKKEVYPKYAAICQEVERKKAEAKKEEDRIGGIQTNMANFKTDMAVKLAAATKFTELVAIERLINLETANKTKYAECLDQFRIDCREISGVLAVKKEAARRLEGLTKEGFKLAENNEGGENDEKLLEIGEKQEELQKTLSETGVNLVETAVRQGSKPTTSVTQIFANVPRGGRRLWRYEVVDWKAAQKAGLTKTVFDEEKINARLKEIRESETEVTENGIRYFVHRVF